MEMLKVKVMPVQRAALRVLLSSRRASTSICAPSGMNFTAFDRRIEQGPLTVVSRSGSFEE
jgi:hypothetical protein